MNTDWQWVQLGEISEVISKGTTPTTHGVAFLDSGIPFLRAEDVVGGAVDVTSVKYYVSDKTHDTLLARSKLQPGDFLITIAGSLGRVGYVPLNAPSLNCNQAVAFVRLKPNVIDLDFLLYVFQYEGITKSLLDVQKVGTIGNLNLEQIRDFKIPLPPLTEQKRIASLLARADRLRQLRRTAHDLGDALLQSVFLEMFGDPVTNSKKWDVEVISEFVKPTKQMKPQLLGRSDFWYVDITSIDRQSKTIVEPKLLKIEEAPSRARKHISANDILVSTVRPNLNAVAKVPKYLDNQIASTGFCVLRPDTKKLNSEYLFAIVQSNYFVDHLVKNETGANYPAVSDGIILDTPIPIPPLSLQEEFAGVVARVESLRGRMGESTRQVEGLFESLLAEAFDGHE